MSILIIAEVGECFNGDLDVARELIAVASDAGCNVVKFQTLDQENIAPDDPEALWLQKIALDPFKVEYLVACGNNSGIEVLFTPENVKTGQWLLNAGLKDVKIASSSVSDTALITFVGSNFRRVFMSTGMASLDEINQAVSLLKNVPELYIMHCISEYPTGPLLEKRGLVALSAENVRLNMMRILMDLYPYYKIGYSDHTTGILAPVAAVAMGAQVIEKHITLDRSTPLRNFQAGGPYLGTDHVLSLEPAELGEMVRMIREVEQMMGPWEWDRTEGEKILKNFIRGRFI